MGELCDCGRRYTMGDDVCVFCYCEMIGEPVLVVNDLEKEKSAKEVYLSLLGLHN